MDLDGSRSLSLIKRIRLFHGLTLGHHFEEHIKRSCCVARSLLSTSPCTRTHSHRCVAVPIAALTPDSNLVLPRLAHLGAQLFRKHRRPRPNPRHIVKHDFSRATEECYFTAQRNAVEMKLVLQGGRDREGERGGGEKERMEFSPGKRCDLDGQVALAVQSPWGAWRGGGERGFKKNRR